MVHQESLTAYLSSFITGLIRSGVQDFVISPGSRSTPLAVLAVQNKNLNVFVNIDERSAAFFALGLAKASGRPVALLCTSGTAAANYYPAIIEANLTGVPLVVLTADRPHELRNVGAPQAIDQLHLYGNHVKSFTEMAIPELHENMLIYAEKTALKAVNEAETKPKGPVHLNFPLREPLMPDMDNIPNDRTQAPALVNTGYYTLPETKLTQWAAKLSTVKKGIIICGPMDNSDFSSAILTFAEKLGFPVLADPLSQLRSRQDHENIIIDSYDAILKSKENREKLKPELIIRFGGMPVSKSLTFFMREWKDIDHVIIDGGFMWRDPHHLATDIIYSDEALFCKQIVDKLHKPQYKPWLDTWNRLEKITKDTISFYMNAEDDLNEGKVVYELSKIIPTKSTVFVGNSMPIRDVDTFFHQTQKDVRIMANRGANGIDGVVSTALGASVYQRPLYLLIGDLSFFHDLNGLLAAKMYKLNIHILLINNDGGGIFSFLPQANEAKHFELLFGTPTGLDFEHAVKMYGGKYKNIADWTEFEQAIKQTSHQEGLNVIEIQTDREKNAASHRQIWQHVSREIYNFLQDVDI